jgi:hypothetical protein
MATTAAQRRLAASNALASIRLEGAVVDTEMQELADLYAAGQLDADELAEYARTGHLPTRQG